MSRLHHLFWTACAVVLSASGVARAEVVEDIIDVPVTVRSLYGQTVAQSIKVTVFHDDARPKSPWLVLNHGRPPTAAGFATMDRQRFAANSRYFVSLGFVVLVPTRIGYGVSGGPDVEDSGRCDDRRFGPAYAAAADQTISVLKAAAQLPYVDLSRGIVVGHSFGGTTSIALAARELPGLLGAVNFSGGGGGNPESRPENPCGSARLASLFADYGTHAKVPTLWLYSVNDRYWGPDLPRKWYDGFVHAGGKGSFVSLPAFKDNGHGIFVGDPSAWKPALEGFLREIGL